MNLTHSAAICTEFEKHQAEWTELIPYAASEHLYSDNLLAYLCALEYQGTPDRLKRAETFLRAYEDYKLCHYPWLSSLYLAAGKARFQLGPSYDEEAIQAFRKALFYLLDDWNHTFHSLTYYSFRPCKDYVIEALQNEEIAVTSPRMFNDTFDCPIIALLDPNDRMSALMKEACLQSIHIGCFVSYASLPEDGENDPNDALNWKAPSLQPGTEYTHELMWAHYTDSHRGICIRYRFPRTLNAGHIPANQPIRFFRDIEYVDHLQSLNLLQELSLKDAFFQKSCLWAYEHEVRLLQCSCQEKGNFATVPAPGCVGTVYFGAHCSDADQQRIRNALTGRSVKFYQMKYNSNSLGVLQALPLS